MSDTHKEEPIYNQNQMSCINKTQGALIHSRVKWIEDGGEKGKKHKQNCSYYSKLERMQP